MEDVIYKDDDSQSVGSNLLPFEIQYHKDSKFLMILDNYVNFIKGCERFIRRSNDYNHYVATLKELGFTHCQVLGNIDSSMGEPGHDVSVEMHHGPIFTLFDYCACIVSHMIKHNKKVNTPKVSKIIMDEHWNGNIQTVMLSTSVHQAVDSGKLFINLNQAFGNLNQFIKKYEDGLTEHQKGKINKYIQLSKKYKSTDNGIFDLQETMHSWTKKRLR